MKSRAAKASIAVVVVVLVVSAVYVGVTYPRAILTVPVSFTVGADVISTQFDQPALNNRVKVQVSVESGLALWQARIFDGEQIMWQYATGQSEQQTYDSGWIDLPSGNYNFTFGAIGGVLDAMVIVSTKGGFW